MSEPITLAHYVATFDGSTPEQQADAAAAQLAANAAHFGEQAAMFLRGAREIARVAARPDGRHVDLLDYASDAARVAWRFASDAHTVWTWNRGDR